MSTRTRILAPLGAVAALAAAAPAAHATITLDGRGFGHGVGLSQYGAYGYALKEGRDAAWILGHYYQGTTVAAGPSTRMRVLLKAGHTQTICGATRVRDAARRAVSLVDARAYRVRPVSGGRLRVSEARSGRMRATLRAPLRVTGGESVCVRGRADSGLKDGSYRGALRLVRTASGVQAISDVAMRDYLAGVVPAEMPTSWSIEAVKAQAIVARSYAVRALSPGRAFDVYADTRSQVYRGMAAETPAGTQAVGATDGLVVMYAGEVAQTFFSSTSGGQTAANEEAFAGAPVPYLRSVVDAYDDISPVHTWTETFPQAVAQTRLRGLVRGTLRELRVAQKSPSGRVQRVDVVGSAGTRTVTGATIRAKLDLRSTWFTVRAPAG